MPTTNWTHKRPAPRKAHGAPKQITDDVTWTRTLSPHERYRIAYVDRNGEHTERTIELLKMGNSKGIPYVSVIDQGRPKTFRQDRIVAVLEQISTGHSCSLHAAPTYKTELPRFPIPGAIHRIATTAISNRSWTVDLNTYTCTCPEKRIRTALGYQPGQLGYVCAHMAKAILGNLPFDADGWSSELRAFLADPRRVHIDNLI